jgi:hypothetical protein
LHEIRSPNKRFISPTNSKLELSLTKTTRLP